MSFDRTTGLFSWCAILTAAAALVLLLALPGQTDAAWKCMMLTVVSNPVQGGDVAAEPASTSGAYYPYDNVTLTAVAKPGYVFVNWTGDVAHIEDTTQETIIVAMDKYYADNVEDIQITANFEKRGRFPWAWLAGGIVTLLLTALAVSMLVLRRKRLQADIPPQ